LERLSTCSVLAGDQDVPVTLRVSATLQRTHLPFIR
jgi:hypothetical protein